MKLFLICCASKVRDNQNALDLTTNAKENEMIRAQSQRQHDRKGVCKIFGIFFILLFTFTAFAQKPELVVQTGHHSSVKKIAFSPDGELLVSVASDGEVILWNVLLGAQLNTLKGHQGDVYAAAFNPVSKLAATGGEDKTVKLWDLLRGGEPRTLKGHLDEVRGVVFSPDGKILASGSTDKTVKFWSVETGKEIFSINAESYVYEVAFSPNNKLIAIGTIERKIEIWDITSKKKLNSITTRKPDELSFYPISIAFSADSKMLASGQTDKTVKLWNISDGKIVSTFVGHKEEVTSVAFSPYGETLVSGSADNTVKLWNVKTGAEIKTYKHHFGGVYSVAFNPKYCLLASAGGDSIIQMVDTADDKTLRQFAGLTSRVNAVTFSPDGKFLASSGDMSDIKLWNFQSRGEIYTLETGAGYVSALAFSPDGKMLANHSGKRMPDGNYQNSITVWDVTTKKQIRSFDVGREGVDTIRFSPDGKILACGGDDYIKFLDITNGKELGNITLKETRIRVVAFSPDGKILASGDSKGTIKLWDVASRKELHTFKKHSDSIVFLEFHNEKLINSGSMDSSLKQWKIETGEDIAETKGYYAIENKMALTPDGKFHVIATPGDVKIALGDSQTGKLLAYLIVIDKNSWVAITPDGLFDGSPEGQRYLHFVVGLEPIALDQLKERYYEPGLLKKIINNEPLRNVKVFNDVKLFPKVEFQPPASGSTKMTINLTNRGGGIGRVQVFVNGKEFISDARPKGFNPKSQTATLTVDLKNSPYISGRKNNISVVAWNYDDATKEGYISSRGDEVVWAGEGEEEKDPPELYAIIGGVSDYSGDALDLRFAAKDAEDFAKALEIGSKKLFGAEKVHIKLLTTNSTDTTLRPTKENFRKAFEEFRKAKPTDILIVYLAGHGVTLQRGSDLYLYLTQEARTTDKSVLSDESLRRSLSVSSEELVEWIKLVPALKQAMILDTCAAGAAVVKLTEKREISGDAIRAIDRLKDRTNFYVLMGSSADAVSYEASQYGQGLLTYSLLSAMKGAKLREGQYADVSELFQYAADTVPELAKNIGGIQRPIVAVPTRVGYQNSSLTAGSFDIGLFTKMEQAQVPFESPKPLILRPRLQNRDSLYDDLELEPVLQKTLRQKSAITERGSAEMIYVDADEMADAIRVSGNYVVEGNVVKVTLVLLRNNKPIVSPITITGTKDNKDELIKKIVETVSKNARGA